MYQGTISLKTVLHEIQEPGTLFSIKFRKLDGGISEKHQVKKNPTKVKTPAGTEDKKDLSTVRRNMTKAGALLLYDERTKERFECKIELLVAYNGYRIFHNY
ncbi:hypothetical protein [Siphonobacter sp. SORGH_AS_0500]|uniref:hypothetical protein n=1 Tax=Siphonobacter sp. SORGH_AS_0500 TaxID=1864824 RepID=UPI0028570DEB|nr:hypothetical protein [Siphonobacter sp. SORGH_AS_0500]MDR6195178.1 hypothetical protein [Siphonobacter sp. SORGH_AS_0500]